ncbi:hypothetical protein M427DRAFT_35702 [Gonapodya prolifera JEL478]|uniref:Uncharacterized protein n=1 Tax=Gonapodya prolifera (strain JEL478) TaxID=1344416 RepID=A0A139A435_GONPJ|nr:hypothetical protein M427DRAFT_35702 [Gonapodya prolifera JEL478]|eukprot:KXS11586.1 hypothetical protein M427DRAFT_35702 [Gonapodya prolifera JEL478]
MSGHARHHAHHCDNGATDSGSGNREGCVHLNACAKKLGATMHTWTPAQLAMELAHSLCCDRGCMDPIIGALHEMLNARGSILKGKIELSEDLITFCLHAPGFFASTPIVGYLANIVTVGANIGSAINLDNISKVVGQQPPGSIQYDQARFILVTLVPFTVLLDRLVTACHGLVPYIINNESAIIQALFDFLAHKLTRCGKLDDYSDGVVRLVTQLLYTMVFLADLTSNRQTFKLLKFSFNNRGHRGEQ